MSIEAWVIIAATIAIIWALGGVESVLAKRLDRIVEERQPDTSNPASLVVKSSFFYTDQPNNTSVKRIVRLNDSLAVESYTYVDGFGRTVYHGSSTCAGSSIPTEDTWTSKQVSSAQALRYTVMQSCTSPPALPAVASIVGCVVLLLVQPGGSAHT